MNDQPGPYLIIHLCRLLFLEEKISVGIRNKKQNGDSDVGPRREDEKEKGKRVRKAEVSSNPRGRGGEF